MRISFISIFFFFNDTATTEIYTLSLHDALPISATKGAVISITKSLAVELAPKVTVNCVAPGWVDTEMSDRKSTRLNSSHSQISYAVFCLKKKKKQIRENAIPNDTSQ